jgi:hypothetical protein
LRNAHLTLSLSLSHAHLGLFALAEKEEVIAEKDEVIAEKDEVSAHLKEEIARKEEVIAEKDEVIAQKEEVIIRWWLVLLLIGTRWLLLPACVLAIGKGIKSGADGCVRLPRWPRGVAARYRVH